MNVSVALLRERLLGAAARFVIYGDNGEPALLRHARGGRKVLENDAFLPGKPQPFRGCKVYSRGFAFIRTDIGARNIKINKPVQREPFEKPLRDPAGRRCRYADGNTVFAQKRQKLPRSGLGRNTGIVLFLHESRAEGIILIGIHIPEPHGIHKCSVEIEYDPFLPRHTAGSSGKKLLKRHAQNRPFGI